MKQAETMYMTRAVPQINLSAEHAKKILSTIIYHRLTAIIALRMLCGMGP